MPAAAAIWDASTAIIWPLTPSLASTSIPWIAAHWRHLRESQFTCRGGGYRPVLCNVAADDKENFGRSVQCERSKKGGKILKNCDAGAAV